MKVSAAQNDGSLFESRWKQATACVDNGDLQGALFILEALAAEGESYALVEIGNLYERGVDGAPDFEEAAKWYRKAVFAVDDPKAHLGLARMLFNRQLKGTDDAEAFSRHAISAADRGEPHGLMLLGFAYEGGRLGIVDKEKAALYYERAASEGMILAERRLVRLALDSHRYFAATKLFLVSFFKSLRIAIRNPRDPRLAGISPVEGSFTTERNSAHAETN